MVPFDVVKLLFETVTPLFKRMEGGVTVSNEFNKRQTASSLFLFLTHQKLLPSFPSPLDVTGASPFPPRSFLSLVCITYFEFRARRIPGTKTYYSQSTKRRQNGFENVEEGIFPYNCLCTQAVAYTTYFELREPVRGTGTQNTKWRLDWLDYRARYGETSRVFLDMAHLQPEFYLLMGKSFNISFNFMFFS